MLPVSYHEINAAGRFANVGNSVIEGALCNGQLIYDANGRINRESLAAFAKQIEEQRDRHGRVLRYIIAYKIENDGIAPSYDEIKAACGLSSKSIVYTLVQDLIGEGKLRLICKGSARNIAVVGGQWTCNTVTAGSH